MSDSESPASITERAAEPALEELRARSGGAYAAAAAVLERALRDDTLTAHLTPKALGTLATELLAALPANATADDDADR